MNKVRFYNSVRFKFVLIFVMLILIAMQIISVYFVDKLEEQLVSNFQKSNRDRVLLLAYTVQNEMIKQRSENDLSLQEVLSTTFNDYVSDGILETLVIDENSQIIFSSEKGMNNQVDQQVNDMYVQRVISTGIYEQVVLIDDNSGKKIWVLIEPLFKDKKEVIGCLYVTTDIEEVYKQVGDIYLIMGKGTLIAIVVTALLGLIISFMITIPISEIRKQALSMSKGLYIQNIKKIGNDEIGQLAYTFNILSKELRKSQSIAEQEKRKIASILMNMSDGVIATDKFGVVIIINEQAMKMLGISCEKEATSKTIIDLLDIHAEYTFENLLKRKESLIFDYSDKAKEYYLRAHFSAIQEGTKDVKGLIAVLHDVTEQEKIEEERKEFVVNVSHELRTPLTSMRSYLEALSDGALNNEVLSKKFLTVVQDETNRMIRMVKDLLNLSKLEDGRSLINREWVEFVSFFDKVIARFELSIERNITFERKFPNYSIFVEIDRDKIIQVIDNIISNALKYSPEGGNITFKARVINEKLEVSIRDEGMGMPKGNAEKIFNRFYRVDKARSRMLGGTGLGLAIAKEIITGHGGNIFARSIEGVGTSIIFDLPYDPKVEEDWE